MIPVDSLLLLGIIYCEGYISHKAQAFHRVVCPEQEKLVSISDKDLKTCVRFLITTSTIFERMTRDIIKQKVDIVNYFYYEKKVKKYDLIYEDIVEQFTVDIFGDYWNKVDKKVFVHHLSVAGWKYFTVLDLNTLFDITIERH